MMNKRKNNCGFTLLELVISVSVLVILTGVTAPVFTKYIEKGQGTALYYRGEECLPCAAVLPDGSG